MKTDVDSALKDIANFYVKKRRSMTEPELHSILLKHCESEAEIKKFDAFLATEPGQLRFKTLLRERKETSSSSNPEKKEREFRVELEKFIPSYFPYPPLYIGGRPARTEHITEYVYAENEWEARREAEYRNTGYTALRAWPIG